MLSSSRTARLAATLVLAILVARASAVAWVCDDAFITFRTVDHVLRGDGPRWNAAERVQAYTHPLWMLAVTAVTAVNRDAYRASMLLGLAATAFAGLWLLLRIARTPGRGALALAVLALSASCIDYATSGLENSLVHLWTILFAAVVLSRTHWTARDVGACFGLAGLAACTRLDALVAWAPLLAFVATRVDRRVAFRAALYGALPLVAWHGFALVYYGTLLPNSATAKLTHGFGAGALWTKGVQYGIGTVLHDPVAAVAIVVAAVVAVASRDTRLRFAVAGIALHLVYVVVVGGDFMSGRFVSGCVWLAAVVWAWAPWRARPAIAAACALGVAALAAPGSPLRPIALAGPRLERTIDARGIADERRFYAPLTAWRQGRGQSVWPDPGTAAAVRSAYTMWEMDPFIDLLRQLELVSDEDSIPAAVLRAARLGETRPVVLVPAVGTYGWYAGDRLHVLDLYGLGDPLLARLPAVRPDPLLGRFAPRLATLGWRQGHFIRRVPEGYVATLSSGRNHLVDPDLARYWDDLALATRAPLAAPGRAAAILRLLRGSHDPRLARARARIQAAHEATR